MTKNTPFFPILHVFEPLNDVLAYIAWSWKTTLITWFFFYEDDIQLQLQVAPPGLFVCFWTSKIVQFDRYTAEKCLNIILEYSES